MSKLRARPVWTGTDRGIEANRRAAEGLSDREVRRVMAADYQCAAWCQALRGGSCTCGLCDAQFEFFRRRPAWRAA